MCSGSWRPSGPRRPLTKIVACLATIPLAQGRRNLRVKTELSSDHGNSWGHRWWPHLQATASPQWPILYSGGNDPPPDAWTICMGQGSSSTLQVVPGIHPVCRSNDNPVALPQFPWLHSVFLDFSSIPRKSYQLQPSISAFTVYTQLPTLQPLPQSNLSLVHPTFFPPPVPSSIFNPNQLYGFQGSNLSKLS